MLKRACRASSGGTHLAQAEGAVLRLQVLRRVPAGVHDHHPAYHRPLLQVDRPAPHACAAPRMSRHPANHQPGTHGGGQVATREENIDVGECGAHLLALVRLRPRPPARVEMRNRKREGELLKLSTIGCSRARPRCSVMAH